MPIVGGLLALLLSPLRTRRPPEPEPVEPEPVDDVAPSREDLSWRELRYGGVDEDVTFEP